MPEEQNNGTTVITSEAIDDTGTNFQLPETPPIEPFNFASVPLPEILEQASEPTQTERTQDDLSSRLLESVGQLGGRQEVQLAAEEEAGVPELQRQLQEFTQQIQSLGAQFEAAPLELQEGALGRGVTTGGLEPIQASKQRKIAIQALGVSALAQATQGNLALAQQTADRAVELEFAPIEAEIGFLREALSLNEKRLAREDARFSERSKQRFDWARLMLDQRQRAVDNQKEERRAVMAFAAQAAENGAPREIVTNALTTQSPEESLALLSNYMADPLEAQRALFDMKVTNAQLKLSQDKFEEDKRQFNEEMAFKEQALLQEQRRAAMAAAAENEVSSYAKERATRTIQSVDELLGQVNKATVGFAVLTAGIPQSSARNFRAQLDTLKSNIAFGELTAMREASKTGGALGQVSDREGRLLESALGALDQGQSPEQFKQQLEKIKGSIQRWNQAAQQLEGGDVETGVYESASGNVYLLPN